MIWKPKEKDLTLEEAIALAKKELTPFWFGVAPQFAGVPSAGGYSIFPLNEEFVKESWLLFIVDPTGYSENSTQALAREFHRRYHALDLKVLVVMACAYSFLKDVETLTALVDSWDVRYQVMLDVDHSLKKSLNVVELPKVVLLFGSNRHFEYEGTSVLKHSELALQAYLRSTDPGLPLFPAFKPTQEWVNDIGRVEFGYSPGLGVPYSFDAPGFVTPEVKVTKEEIKSQSGPAQAHVDLPKEGNFKQAFKIGSPLRAGQVALTGRWQQDQESIFTSDPSAMIQFLAPSSRIGVVAKSLSKTIDHPIVVVEANGTPFFEIISGEDLAMDDLGNSVLPIKSPRMYHLAQSLQSSHRLITMKTENADIAPVAFYGLRFGDSFSP